jgi:hypothetical protein
MYNNMPHNQIQKQSYNFSLHSLSYVQAFQLLVSYITYIISSMSSSVKNPTLLPFDGHILKVQRTKVTSVTHTGFDILRVHSRHSSMWNPANTPTFLLSCPYTSTRKACSIKEVWKDMLPMCSSELLYIFTMFSHRCYGMLLARDFNLMLSIRLDLYYCNQFIKELKWLQTISGMRIMYRFLWKIISVVSKHSCIAFVVLLTVSSGAIALQFLLLFI